MNDKVEFVLKQWLTEMWIPEEMGGGSLDRLAQATIKRERWVH